MKYILVLTLILQSLRSSSQIQYYDAVKLRTAIRYIYVWNITSIDAGVPPTMKFESAEPYIEPIVKNDEIIGGKHIHFVSHQPAKIGFSREINLYELVKLILRFYSQHPNDTDFDIIKTDFTGNAFINPFIVNGNAAAGDIVSGFFSTGLSSIGNLNVTNFADGLAKFLVERSKEELNVAFFRKFQEFLKGYPEIKTVFPTTVGIINTLVAYKYAAILPALRAAFQKDLNSVSSNLINLRSLTIADCPITDANCNARIAAINAFFATVPGRAVIGSLIVADHLVKGKNAAEVIDAVAEDKICTAVNDNFSNSFQFANLISQSLRSTDDGKVWITKEQVNSLIKDEITLKLYLGLLYASNQKNSHHIEFNIGGTVVTLNSFLTQLSIKWAVAAPVKFIESFNEVAQAASDVADNAKTVIDAKKQNEVSPILQYADYASSVSSFLKLSLQFLPQNAGISPALSGLTTDIQKFTSVIDAATGACYDIKSQNYSALVLHTALLLSEIPGLDAKMKDDYIKYGTFMANVVEAKNSDEVKAAIEAAVLPVGSSSVKRETDVNISLNAFIGPFAGAEYLPKLKQNQWAFTAGVTAPVGVAFSWGNKRGKPEKGGKSISLFIPLIDVGSMAAFRLSNDESKVASEVKLSNIVSPGFYVYYGFGKCPVSLGIGGQVGPQLREVTTTNVNIDKNYYLRFGLNLVVDIPLLNFYTKN